jgi:DNA-binding MarR family transcriptional regulator
LGRTVDPPDIDNTGQLLYLAHRAARARANRAMQSLGIDLRGLGVLTTLAAHGPLSQRQLGRIIDLDKSSMVLLADALERAGLIVRMRTARDRRAYAVEITAAGRDRMAHAAQYAATALDDVLARFSVQERAQLNVLLRKIVTRARELEQHQSDTS